MELNSNLQKTFDTIVSRTKEMVQKHVDRKDLTGTLDYMSIYSQTENQYKTILSQINDLGTVGIKNTTGNYIELNKPITIGNQTRYYCRVRKPDNDHLELGYADFEVVNYSNFKEKYLNRKNFSLLTKGEEMIELKDPEFNVRAYFLSGEFYFE